MFNKDFIKQSKNFILFILIFSIIFFILMKTIAYTIPFIIAYVIAKCTTPFTKLLQSKLKFGKSISAFISTILVFTLLVFLVSILIYKITDESRQLLASMPSFDNIQTHVGIEIGKARLYFKHLDPTIVLKIQEQISAIVSSSLDFTANILNTLISLAVNLPLYLMLVVVTLLSTYFFTKETPDISKATTRIFSTHYQEKINRIRFEALHMLGEYIKAYSIIITISFIEILIGLTFFRVKYALILSLFCWVLEIIPVLGIFIVFFPLIGLYVLSNHYIIAIGLGILWVIVVLVRQIIEPKIVSSTLDLHPLAVIGAIFIGLSAYGFIGMIYILSGLVFYKILNKVDVL